MERVQPYMDFRRAPLGEVKVSYNDVAYVIGQAGHQVEKLSTFRQGVQ